MKRIGIIDKDSLFIERLKNVFEENYPSEFEFINFKSINKAQTATEKFKLSALLINPETVGSDKKFIPELRGAYPLLEDREACKNFSVPAVYKYQSIDEWHESLTTLCMAVEKDYKGGDFSTCELSNRLCLFSSTGGGVGASAACAAYCRCLAANGLSALYLNFESLCSAERYFDCINGVEACGACEIGMDELLDEIRCGGASFQDFLIRDKSGVFLVKPFGDIRNLFSLNGEEICKICEALGREVANFTKKEVFVVVDIGLDATENFVLPFLQADRTVLVTDGSSISNCKLIKLISALPKLCEIRPEEALKKIFLLYNRFDKLEGKLLEDTENELSSIVSPMELGILLEKDPGKLGGIERIEADTGVELSVKMSKMLPFKRLMKDMKYIKKGANE